MVTFTVICEELTLPIYIYSLKNNQVDTKKDDHSLKEECELKAVSSVLRLIRERYPRLFFTFLGDALYANKGFLKFCDQIGMDYTIVLKDTKLKTLNQKCEELSRTISKPLYSPRNRETHRKRDRKNICLV